MDIAGVIIKGEKKEMGHELTLRASLAQVSHITTTHGLNKARRDTVVHMTTQLTNGSTQKKLVPCFIHDISGPVIYTGIREMLLNTTKHSSSVICSYCKYCTNFWTYKHHELEDEQKW